MTAKIKRRLEGEGGFTLIELLVVIIILGILLAIAVPSYLGFKDRADKASAQSNARAALPSIEAYYSDKGTYATMTVPLLQASYDQSIQAANATKTAGLSVTGLSATGYTVCSFSNGYVGWKAGPGGQLQVNKKGATTAPVPPAGC